MYQMRHEWPCYYSVVRYIADPYRDEPRNIGIIVLCPEQQFGGARFRLERAGIPRGTRRYQALDALLSGYFRDLSGSLPPSEPRRWTPETLRTLHENFTDLVQFSAPVSAVGDPTTILERLFRERVLPRRDSLAQARSGAVRTTARALRTALAPLGKSDWVHVGRSTASEQSAYPFALAVRNGRLYYALETVSFTTSHPQRAEEHGAWYAKVWSEARQVERYAQGILLFEPPIGRAAGEQFQHVMKWVREVDIQPRLLAEVTTVAQEIANVLANFG